MGLGLGGLPALIVLLSLTIGMGGRDTAVGERVVVSLGGRGTECGGSGLEAGDRGTGILLGFCCQFLLLDAGTGSFCCVVVGTF